ncbi:hypothetical protein ACR3K2_25180 [Cryptosporidium serpentis]
MINLPLVSLPSDNNKFDVFEKPEQQTYLLVSQEEVKEKKRTLKLNPDLWFEENLEKTNCETYEKEITCRNLNLLRSISRFIGKQRLLLKKSRESDVKIISQYFLEFPKGSNQLEEPAISWDIDDDHPLKSTICPGPPSRSCLSNNWYHRINWTSKHVWDKDKNSNIVSDSKFIDCDLRLVHELGLFYTACRSGVVALLHCHPSFNYGISKCFYEVNKDSDANLWSIYKPVFSDDRVFIFDSIVYTIIFGSKNDGITKEMAKRIYNNEFKAKKALCEVLIQIGSKSLFSFPACCLIKYMGYSVFCEPLIPFNPKPKNIIKDMIKFCKNKNSYNSIFDIDNEFNKLNLSNNNDDVSRLINNSNIKNTIFDGIWNYNNELANQMTFISKQLNIQGWPFPMETSDFTSLYGIKYKPNIWQHRSDGLFIVRNCGEMFPVYIDENKEINPFSRLRHEFLITHNESLLPSTQSIPLFFNTATGDIKSSYYMDEINDKSYISKLDMLSKNFSMESRHQLLYAASQSMRLKFMSNLLPTINELYTNFYDPWEITEILHNFGINLHYGLGQLVQDHVIEPLRSSAIREIFARTIKRLWEEEVHRYFKNQTLVNEETIQITIVDYLNKILCNTDQSTTYWNTRIIPSANKRFNLNKSSSRIQKSSVLLLPLFHSIQYHLGVQFRSSVISKEGVLILPLKIDDLCDFSEININMNILFPQVKYLKYTLAHTQKLKFKTIEKSFGEYISNKTNSKINNEIRQKVSPLLKYLDYKEINNQNPSKITESNQKNVSNMTEVWAWNETRVIRGYYPKSKIIIPKTLTSINICKSILCQYLWKLQILPWNSALLGNNKINKSIEEQNNKIDNIKRIFTSSITLFSPIYANITTMGNIAPMRASLNGYGTPCNPKCKYSTFLNFDDSKIDEEPYNFFNKCIWYNEAFTSIYYISITKILAGESIERIFYSILFIGYLTLQHNNIQKCLTICDLIQTHAPEIPRIQILVLILRIQCYLRLNKLEEANVDMNYLHKLTIPVYGESKYCLILIQLQLCFSMVYYINKNYAKCFENSSKIQRLLDVILNGINLRKSSTHWITIINLRFMALCSLNSGYYARSIVIGERMLRSIIKNNSKQIYSESICRYIIGEATIRSGKYDEAAKILLSCIPNLDYYIGPTHKFTIKLLMLSTRCRIITGCRDLMFPPLNLQDRQVESDERFQNQMVDGLFRITRQTNIQTNKGELSNMGDYDILENNNSYIQNNLDNIKNNEKNKIHNSYNFNNINENKKIISSYDDGDDDESNYQGISYIKPYWRSFPKKVTYDDILVMEKSIFDRISAKSREEALILCRTLLQRLLTNIRGTGNIINVSNNKESENQIWYNRILWVLKHELVIALFSMNQNDYIDILSSIRTIAISSSASQFVKDLTIGKITRNKNNFLNEYQINNNQIENIKNNKIEDYNKRKLKSKVSEYINKYNIVDNLNIGQNDDFDQEVEYINNYGNQVDNHIINNLHIGASVAMSPRQMGHKSQEKLIFWEILIAESRESIVDICNNIYDAIIQKKTNSAYEWCTSIIHRISTGKADTKDIETLLNLIRLLLSKFHKKYMIELLYPETRKKRQEQLFQETNSKCKCIYGLQAYSNISNKIKNNRLEDIYGKLQFVSINDNNNNNSNINEQNYCEKIIRNTPESLVLPHYETRVAGHYMLPIEVKNQGTIDINKDKRWQDPYRNYKYFDIPPNQRSPLYIPKNI